LPAELSALETLAMNLRWSWDDQTRDLFRWVDPEQWERVGHDPVKLLGAVRSERLAELAADVGFLERLRHARADLEQYLTADRWYQTHAGEDAPRSIAYFSPEFGITAVLPQYSGGLGILAGDHLKTASDLGVPIIGVGLLYRHGYFRQSLSRDGWQQETYPVLDPDGLPLSLLREEDGSVAKIEIGLPSEESLTARIWVAQVGRVPLLLLDSDVEENSEVIRTVTDRLYGGNTEHRLRQEILLGVGGVRALAALGLEPDVFHMNEGHAGFLVLERVRRLVADSGLTPSAAFEQVRVEQEQAHPPDLDAPHLRVHGDAGQLDRDPDGVAVGPGGEPHRQHLGVEGRVVLLLQAARREGLAEVAGAVEEPDGRERHAEVAGGLQVVAGQDAQPAGVLR
jgi:starch phosphorylase